MAGVKGKSGGPRVNSGGARLGAGRPKLVAEIPAMTDPMKFLLALMDDEDAGLVQRLEAAKILLPYFHRKLETAGKKEKQAQAAKVTATGRFAPIKPPKLVTVMRLPVGED